jgi:hypothetical protein
VTEIPEEIRLAAFRAAVAGSALFLINYRPEEEGFFKGGILSLSIRPGKYPVFCGPGVSPGPLGQTTEI